MLGVLFITITDWRQYHEQRILKFSCRLVDIYIYLVQLYRKHWKFTFHRICQIFIWNVVLSWLSCITLYLLLTFYLLLFIGTKLTKQLYYMYYVYCVRSTATLNMVSLAKLGWKILSVGENYYVLLNILDVNLFCCLEGHSGSSDIIR